MEDKIQYDKRVSRYIELWHKTAQDIINLRNNQAPEEEIRRFATRRINKLKQQYKEINNEN